MRCIRYICWMMGSSSQVEEEDAFDMKLLLHVDCG